MRKAILILFLVVGSRYSYAQDSMLKIVPVQTIKGTIEDFTTDNLGNIYLVLPGNRVKKINANGDSIAVYNDVKRYGSIYSIDATNPLKILVFFKDFSTIVILDRLLAVRTVIDLRKQNILQVNAITSSYDNNIWLYDELESKLKKVDDRGNVLLESTDFRQVFERVPTPSDLYDRDGQLYMYDSSQGLLIFDYYGAKKNDLRLLNYKDLQVVDKNTITARDESHIFLYQPGLMRSYYFSVFEDMSKFSKINFNGRFFYCLTKAGDLEAYETTKN